jgi:hypothetical protein
MYLISVSSTIRVKCLDNTCLDNLDAKMVGMLAVNTEDHGLYAKFYRIDISKHTQHCVCPEWNEMSTCRLLL